MNTLREALEKILIACDNSENGIQIWHMATNALAKERQQALAKEDEGKKSKEEILNEYKRAEGNFLTERDTLNAMEEYASQFQSVPPYKEEVDKVVIWKKYKRKGLSEMRYYVKGEDLTGISVNKEDNPETDLGMVSRNPKNHNDQWYVARKYFEDNLEEVLESKEEAGEE